ncbi:MAG: hypothetical protein SH848_06565 [Saprospiraceae bacterium]|nr:hypothetical protein [Saprospiraceae bacterium]MDZ4703571.1 hypothetical protein [Saprospiraceae bacterium]
MKKFLLFALTSAVIFSGCLQQQEDLPSIEAAAKVRSGSPGTESLAPGVVPSDIGLSEITLDPDHHTWKDLDDFYKNVVLKKTEESYFSNLQKTTIWHLVEQFGILEKADFQTISYYLEEQRKINLVDGEVFAKCLEKMKGRWMNDAIKLVGMQQYEKSKAYAEANFSPEFWEKHGMKFEKIKEVAQSVPDRWGQY